MIRPFYRRLRRAWQDRRAVRDWVRSGRPAPPPPPIKQQIVRWYGRTFRLPTLIETGTYLGEMVEATRSTFQRIISIEFDHQLFERARALFARYPHITLLQGDSGDVLKLVLPTVTTPAVFWLDAHYSRGITARGALETPIIEELTTVLHDSVPGSVILIDDARTFTGAHDYPRLDELRSFVEAQRPELQFEVRDDVIRLHQSPPTR